MRKEKNKEKKCRENMGESATALGMGVGEKPEKRKNGEEDVGVGGAGRSWEYEWGVGSESCRKRVNEEGRKKIAKMEGNRGQQSTLGMRGKNLKKERGKKSKEASRGEEYWGKMGVGPPWELGEKK